jgi:hypothetical protein
MYTRCYCAFPLFAFAHRLHTRRAHDTPTKPHFLLCHVANSGTIRSTQYYTQHTKETIPDPLMPCDETRRHLGLRPAQPGDGPRNVLTPGNTELGETSGTRNFLSLTSCCLCLWRRPANLATARSTRIFYLWRRPAHLATAAATATATAYLLSVATASATGDGPRNVLTPGNTESMMSESCNVHLSAPTPNYQVELVGSFDSKCRLLSTGSMF